MMRHALVLMLLLATPAALAQTDADGDNLPDEAEAVACGNDATRLVLTTTPYFTCDAPGDLGTNPVTVRYYKNAHFGPDADRDGVPESLVLKGHETTLDPDAPSPVTSRVTEDTVLRLDTNDEDPDTPLVSRIPLGTFPVGYELGPDQDGDGIPAYVDVVRASLTYDRRAPGEVESTPAEGSRVHLDDESSGNGLDQDNDLVLDALEPLLCFLENDATPLDGTCAGTDYAPPPLPEDAQRKVRAAVETLPPL